MGIAILCLEFPADTTSTSVTLGLGRNTSSEARHELQR